MKDQSEFIDIQGDVRCIYPKYDFPKSFEVKMEMKIDKLSVYKFQYQYYKSLIKSYKKRKRKVLFKLFLRQLKKLISKILTLLRIK